jgi:hypothetical protein
MLAHTWLACYNMHQHSFQAHICFMRKDDAFKTNQYKLSNLQKLMKKSKKKKNWMILIIEFFCLNSLNLTNDDDGHNYINLWMRSYSNVDWQTFDGLSSSVNCTQWVVHGISSKIQSISTQPNLFVSTTS